MGLQGISTQSEYGLQDISKLVQFIVDRNIKAVFVETSVNDKPLLSVQEGSLKRGHEVIIGGSLYSDALGGADDPGNTYTNMVTHNVKTIIEALK
jgi:manganese/zinc/iron transport system substrate-binding protein